MVETNFIQDLLLRQSVQLTLLIVIVAAVTRWGCRRRPHAAYLLWLLVIVKSVTPPLLSHPLTGLWNACQLTRQPAELLWGFGAEVQHSANELPRFVAQERTPELDLFLWSAADATTNGQPARRVTIAGGAVAPSARVRVDWSAVLTTWWLVGCAVITTLVFWKWRRWRRLIEVESQAIPPEILEQFDRLRQSLGIRQNVRLLVTAAPVAPAAWSLGRPTVLLPGRLLGPRNADVLEKVLTHELLHIARRDTTITMLQAVAQIIWWFHPLMWWANSQLRHQRERCCDSQTIAWLNCRPIDYARALLNVLEHGRLAQSPQICVGLGSFERVRSRVIQITHGPQRRTRKTPLAAWILFLLSAMIVLPGMSAPRQQEQSPATRETPAGEDSSEEEEGPGPAGISVSNVPPVVITTHPPAGSDNIDPGLQEVRVTFSKSMARRSWSWSSASPDTQLPIQGEPRYLPDGRTCVVQVALEPDRTYAVWLNSNKFLNFRDRVGQPAVPYLLVFRTGEKQ